VQLDSLRVLNGLRVTGVERRSKGSRGCVGVLALVQPVRAVRDQSQVRQANAAVCRSAGRQPRQSSDEGIREVRGRSFVERGVVQ
jgi:hypothetical protein